MKTALLHPQAEGKEALARTSRKLNFLLKHNGSGNISAIADAKFSISIHGNAIKILHFNLNCTAVCTQFVLISLLCKNNS